MPANPTGHCSKPSLRPKTRRAPYPRFPKLKNLRENQGRSNRLLRRYFPKGTTLADVTQSDLDDIALRLNTRPRKTLNYNTPTATLPPLLRRPGSSATAIHEGRKEHEMMART